MTHETRLGRQKISAGFLFLMTRGLESATWCFYLLRTENAIRAKLWRIRRDEKRKRELFEMDGDDHDANDASRGGAVQGT